MVTSVSESIIVEGVTPAEVFAHLTDPANHGSDAGSMRVLGPTGATALTGRGDRFGMRMRVGPFPYRVTNVVVEYERDRRIAWRHFAGHRWRYELAGVSGDGGRGGTLVTETFDMSRVPIPVQALYAAVFGFPDGYRDNLRTSLAGLRTVLQA